MLAVSDSDQPSPCPLMDLLFDPTTEHDTRAIRRRLYSFIWVKDCRVLKSKTDFSISQSGFRRNVDLHTARYLGLVPRRLSPDFSEYIYGISSIGILVQGYLHEPQFTPMDYGYDSLAMHQRFQDELTTNKQQLERYARRVTITLNHISLGPSASRNSSVTLHGAIRFIENTLSTWQIHAQNGTVQALLIYPPGKFRYHAIFGIWDPVHSSEAAKWRITFVRNRRTTLERRIDAWLEACERANHPALGPLEDLTAYQPEMLRFSDDCKN
ncbi:hypothetical protein G7046_g963 [Stylonectria norvegica]|nr:hypothetical protein G7046_g963 [Stylonectria norvegica]